jgi:hypothetical protein
LSHPNPRAGEKSLAERTFFVPRQECQFGWVSSHDPGAFASFLLRN